MKYCQPALDNEYQLGTVYDFGSDSNQDDERESDKRKRRALKRNRNSKRKFNTEENSKSLDCQKSQEGSDRNERSEPEFNQNNGTRNDSSYESEPQIIVDPATQGVSVEHDDPTISVLWDRATQEAIIETSPGPTIAARALAIVHTAIYDAWSAYEGTPISSTTETDWLQRPDAENTEANKTEAMSYAAYQALSDLFPEQQEIFANLMQELGFDPEVESYDPTTAAGVGYLSAKALLEYRYQDGANQGGYDNPYGDGTPGDGTPYSDTTGYQPANTPDSVKYIEQFTPENIPVNNSPLDPETAQVPLTPQFGNVTPFGLESGDQYRPEAPEPFLLVDGTVDLEAGTITLADGEVLQISKDLIGDVINPEFIAQAEEIVEISANLTDEQKLIAEFWEDGPGTSFPPGNSNTFGQYVSARDNHTLDEDVELFLALGNSQLDSAIAAWESKYFYNYARPHRVIRELGEQGLIGEYNEDLGGYAIEAYAGPGQGTQTILASEFTTYQFGASDVAPPFPEYISGHSTFSAAGAEVLEQYTGSDYFGGSVTLDPGSSRFEPEITPTGSVTLDWENFSDFADESGISRLYGGIHFTDGDQNGRALGREVGNTAYEKAQYYINGGEETYTAYADVEDNFSSNEPEQYVVDGSSSSAYSNGEDDLDPFYGEQGDYVLEDTQQEVALV
ncbi:vanadium-dependent haloperoxidase [Pleurocapsa sp. PCC 7319]|uniref:vanadium-dependent haloperoxidase n=1 Tax=Pleurocapsa sp. PCC 7319 TaxID=118161 RepID=UPI00034D0DB9|nr:vanadium-dependent haloperoxidase [Pleurocapsa sp. PCC 7319]